MIFFNERFQDVIKFFQVGTTVVLENIELLIHHLNIVRPMTHLDNQEFAGMVAVPDGHLTPAIFPEDTHPLHISKTITRTDQPIQHQRLQSAPVFGAVSSTKVPIHIGTRIAFRIFGQSGGKTIITLFPVSPARQAIESMK
ncbi:MAG: hypothetical protein ABIL58_25995 [Pseudomonadota bacterium]